MIITLINDKDKWQLTEAVPEELIRSCNVVICALEGEDLKGVLLARAVRKETQDITYLFVAEEARGAGVARDMLKLLILTTQNTIGRIPRMERAQRHDQRLAVFGKGKLPTYKELKAYENDLKKRKMPPTNVDYDGNLLDAADPYGLKLYYDAIKEGA